MLEKINAQTVKTALPAYNAAYQKTVGVAVNDCGKEPCKHGRKCQNKNGDCPEEET